MGIDPGKTGGIAWLNGAGVINAVAMPKTERDVWDVIKEFYKEESFAVIEKVHSMPRQGVKSAFTFGQNYGLLRGLLTASKVPFIEVPPQKWQREMGCLSGGDKNVTKQKAQQLVPEMKITHAIADAVLICFYAQRYLGQEEYAKESFSKNHS